MLTEERYTTQRGKLSRDLKAAQQRLATALAESEGRPTPRVTKCKQDMTALQRQVADLDTAWRATEAQTAERAAVQRDAHRQEARDAIAAALADALAAAQQLHDLRQQYDALVATIEDTDDVIRHTLAPFLRGGSVHQHDAFDLVRLQLPTDAFARALAGKFDIVTHVAERAHSITARADIVLAPSPAPRAEPPALSTRPSRRVAP